MIILITILHIVVSVLLILIVLVQQGKGQDLASAFGGGGSQTAFGARGTATLLSKITAGSAILFMMTSLTLGYLRPAVSNSSNTVVPDIPAASTPEDTSEGEQAPSGEEGEVPGRDEAATDESASAESGGDAEPAEEPAESEPPPPPN